MHEHQASLGRKVANRYQTVAAAARLNEPTADDIAKEAVEYLPMLHHVVLRFKHRLPAHIEFEELRGVAVVGLMRGLSVCTGMEAEHKRAYLHQKIKGAILDMLRAADPLTRQLRKKAREYDAAVQRIEQREGRSATEEDLMTELGVNAAGLSSLLEELRPISFLSLDAELAGGEALAGSFHDRLADPTACAPSETIERDEMNLWLEQKIAGLPKVQQQILDLYYRKDLRMVEIAAILGVSESRICQLHTQAVRSLRVICLPVQ